MAPEAQETELAGASHRTCPVLGDSQEGLGRWGATLD